MDRLSPFPWTARILIGLGFVVALLIGIGAIAMVGGMTRMVLLGIATCAAAVSVTAWFYFSSSTNPQLPEHGVPPRKVP